jgi:acyl-CoA synthetase (NDP forming)
MIRDIKGFVVLEGVRGQPGVDLPALESLLISVSAFISEHPDIVELDLNPVFAYPQGAIAVDARIVLR